MKSQCLNLWSLFFMVVALVGCTKKAEEAAMSQGNTIVEMTTSAGVIVLELDAAKAPVSVQNFLSYVDSGHYNGTIFHRVIDGFMIQGGGFDREMVQKETQSPIKNESNNGLSNQPGTIAMARTNDPNSATAQFFINLVDNRRLDFQSPQNPGYAVFGKVIEGLDVVQKIGKAKTTTKGFYGDVPVETITIEKVSRR
jgi:peptidyl-prolyl cis-trans isomerase B (cyclophilin B)